MAVAFWALAVATLLRAGTVVPALAGRHRRGGARVVVAGILFAIYVINTLLAAGRARTDPAHAATQVWAVGLVGLVLAWAILGLL